MKTLRILGWALLLLALVLLILPPGVPASAQAPAVGCRSKVSLARATNVSSATTCFTVTPVKGGTTLRLDLTVKSGSYNLYVKSGNATFLAEDDRVNADPLSGGLSYILVNPGTSVYTVAVVRTGRSGTARLSPVATYGATLRCSGSTCTASCPLTSVPGSKAGDQVILPAAITKAGRVQVTVSWKGNARLSAVLYGPSVSRTSVMQSSLARRDGASPLTLTYAVRSTNLVRGGKWSVNLSNASRGTGTISSGEVRITYPR